MYSNYNYRLFASIIEKVSGQSYATYIKENIFFPLDMDDSMVSSNADGASGIAVSARNLANFANVFCLMENTKTNLSFNLLRLKRYSKHLNLFRRVHIWNTMDSGWRVTRENNAVKCLPHWNLEWNFCGSTYYAAE